MNNSTQLTMDKMPSIIQEKLDSFQGQNGQLESIWKDLYGFSDRLKAVAMRLNSVKHPDNIPKCETEKTRDAPVDPSQSNDGIIGSIDAIQSQHNDLVNEFHNKIYRVLSSNIEYIESHI